MALPTWGNPISFRDLNADMGNASTATLSLRTAAAYYGKSTPDAMSEFLGTAPQPPSVTSVSMGSTGRSYASTACADTSTTTRWSSGAASIPEYNDIIYTTSAGTTAFNGLDQWWKFDTSYSIKINSIGVVISVDNCGGGGEQ